MIKGNLHKLSNGMLCRNVQHCWTFFYYCQVVHVFSSTQKIFLEILGEVFYLALSISVLQGDLLGEFFGDFVDEKHSKEVLSKNVGHMTVGQIFRTPSFNQGLIKCHFCEHISLQRQLFISHICKHLTLKPFKCRYCEKAYNRKCTLKEHVKIVHSYQNVAMW